MHQNAQKHFKKMYANVYVKKLNHAKQKFMLVSLNLCNTIVFSFKLVKTVKLYNKINKKLKLP